MPKPTIPYHSPVGRRERYNRRHEDRDLQRQRRQWPASRPSPLAWGDVPRCGLLAGAQSETFPQSALRAAGYEAIWQGQKSWNGVAILTRGKALVETRRALPGDDDDLHSRYIEAAVDGLLIGCLYVPNGNPVKSEKFSFKRRWFERLIAHAAELLATGAPVVLVGDYNVMPTELDVYKPERWVNDALFRVEVRDAFRRLAAQGWTDALRTLHPGERIYTFWDYFRNAYARDAGLRIDHLLLALRSPRASRRLASIAPYEVGRKRVTTRRSGSNWRTGRLWERSEAGLRRARRPDEMSLRSKGTQGAALWPILKNSDFPIDHSLRGRTQASTKITREPS
jgi:exodeoxyribonuclease III